MLPLITNTLFLWFVDSSVVAAVISGGFSQRGGNSQSAVGHCVIGNLHLEPKSTAHK